MSATPESVRHVRNFGIILFLMLFVLTIFAYIIGISSILFIRGWKTAYFYITQPIHKQLLYIGMELFTLWKYYLQNFWRINYYSMNFFALKLISCAFLPLCSLFGLVFAFRAPLMDWRPFKKPESVFGDANWATEKEIKKANLRAKEGMLLGKHKGKFLVADGYQHALLFAPTGSGKGVGFVIPNLLFWKDSIIIHDIKLENYELTSGWRSRKLRQKVFLWNPASPDGISHCYNPMDWISDKPGKMVDDIQKICSFLLPKQEFWSNEARSVLLGVMLYLCCPEAKRPRTLGECLRVLRSDDVSYNLAVVMDTIGDKLHPVAYMNIGSYLQKPDKERGSVTSTANSSMELWANPLIDTTTSRSDFNLHKFKTVPHTVYVGLTPDNIERLKPLMSMFYQQAAAFFTEKMPQKHEKYGVMLLLDEFPTLGKMDQIKAGIAYFRGYKVRLFLVVQDTEQLRSIYEDSGMNSFLSNATYRITFAANNVQTAELISKMLGNKTVDQISQNKPRFLDLNPATRSLNVSKTQRALLLPQEIITLPRDDQILLIESFSPIRCKKIKYFEEPIFKHRLLKPIIIPKQKPVVAKRFTVQKPSE